MEKRIIKTLVKYDHALGKDDFVLGRVMGAMAAICKDDPAMGIEKGRGRCKDGNIFVAETTFEKYDTFAQVVESWYPGLCIFGYEG